MLALCLIMSFCYSCSGIFQHCPSCNASENITSCILEGSKMFRCSFIVSCDAQELLLHSFDLENVVISLQFLEKLGFCPNNLKVLRIRNSTFKNLQFKRLTNVKVLDLQHNIGETIDPPDSMQINSLYLKGKK